MPFPAHLSLFPLPLHLIQSLQFDQPFPTQPCPSRALLARFLVSGDGQLFCSMEDFLRDLPALFHSLAPLGSLAGEPTDYLSEELEVCFPEVQEPHLTGEY